MVIDKKKEFSERLNLVLDEAGFEEIGKGRSVELAKLIKVSQRGAHKWLTGESIPKHERIIFICNKFKCDPSWLEYGGKKSHHYLQLVADKKEQYNIAEPEKVLRKAPLISWVQAGDWNEISDIFQPGAAEDYVPTSIAIGSHAFALKVQGTSMENPNGMPTYPNGSIIIVDPSVQAVNGSRVVVRLEDSKAATFKRLVIDGDKKYLEPLNPRYPIMEINGDATICGVVVQTIING